MQGLPTSNQGKPETAEKRGKITQFSKKSRRRMRQFLMDNKPPENWKSYALTLTYPHRGLNSKSDLPEITIEQENKFFHSFIVRLNRWHCSCVWRRELHQVGASHWHCILSTPQAEYWKVQEFWWASLNDVVPGLMNHPGAYERSCKIEPEENSSCWARYLFDHTTKYKKSQCVVSGRSWGVVNRRYFIKQNFEGIALTAEQFFKIQRIKRRLIAPKIYDSRSVFGHYRGFQTIRGLHGRSDWFLEESKILAVKKYCDIITNKGV